MMATFTASISAFCPNASARPVSICPALMKPSEKRSITLCTSTRSSRFITSVSHLGSAAMICCA